MSCFGEIDSRWFLVKWVGYSKPKWKREHLLVRDGCTDPIRDFWSKSGLPPSREFYPNKVTNTVVCTVCSV